jgi:hypothetical protein
MFKILLIGAPIILGPCPSHSAHERVYATNLPRLQRETRKWHMHKEHSVLITVILFPQRLELLLRQNCVTAHAHQS